MIYSGRKKAALTYVATYAFGCFTKHWNNFQILLVGRIFCGVATSLLYSAFESWLVAEHFKVVSPPPSIKSCFSTCFVFLLPANLLARSPDGLLLQDYAHIRCCNSYPLVSISCLTCSKPLAMCLYAHPPSDSSVHEHMVFCIVYTKLYSLYQSITLCSACLSHQSSSIPCA